MSMVLIKAGIKEAADVASALGLSQSFWQGLVQTGKSLFGIQSVWKNLLSKWQEEESYVSWEKLAEAVQEKFGVESSQTILETAGEGICRTQALLILIRTLWLATTLLFSLPYMQIYVNHDLFYPVALI